MIDITDLPKTKPAICKKCGKTFDLTRSKVTGRFNYRLYCPDCSGPAKVKTVICANCGKPFEVTRSTAWGGFSERKYCDDCDITKREIKTTKCQRCGKTIEIKRRENKGGFNDARKLCDECLGDNAKTKTLICQDCGCTFTVDRYQNTGRFKYRKYCDACLLKKDYVKCKKCGKIFKAYRTEQGRKTEIFCSDCRRESWLEKATITCQEKYGVMYPCQRDECIKANSMAISKINRYFHDKLFEQGIDSEYEKVIGGYSYDLILKNKNILIEIDPVYTHNVLGNRFDGFKYDKNKEKQHLRKTNVAESNGYRCIHVWQWDDWDKLIVMFKPKTKLYARKLQLKEITKQDASIFLDKYHLQGSCYDNSVNLGLYQNNELIQVMTFGKPRYNKNYQWELLRLCTHSDYYVVGGAEKLFKYFLKTQKPNSIISYCDISKFTGDVYSKLGFTLSKITEPQKIWAKNNYCFGNCDYITDNLLRQRGFDQLFKTNYGKGTNNEQLMIEHGWLPVFDCGQKVFEWKVKEYNV